MVGQQKENELERKATVRNADDMEAIRKLLAQYCHLLDDLRMEEWGELFCEDAVWTARTFHFEGRAAIVRGVRTLEPDQPGKVRHLTFLPLIELNGDEAHCWADTIALRTADQNNQITTVGRYHDVLRREGGRWRFARRLFVFSGEMPPAGVRPSPGL